MPLPPYIKKQCEDNNDYQTVYAKVPGSAAAPTAGFHFTPELFKEIEAKGIQGGGYHPQYRIRNLPSGQSSRHQRPYHA
jgi:hypothetical protein